jgi:hypothetical protein
VLVDVTETAREAGIRFPVALTAAVWAECVAVPEGVDGQDEAGRLWDVVWMTRCAIAMAPAGADTVPVRLHVRNDNVRPPPVTLKAVCGPGDDGEPVITVMRPDED